uniref:Kelch domain containing 7A n=1 Tax=Neolamprologus brichardi TaxID=32507 RepID=A0A3Q4GZ28_NEOBR
MPIAELLGVQFDMQLLWKLSVSVAAVLLVSWGYRFYSSRHRRRIQLHVKDKEPGNATCQNCETTLQHQSSTKHETDDAGQQSRSLLADSGDDLTSDSSKETPAETLPHQVKTSEDVFATNDDHDTSMDEEIITYEKQGQVATSNVMFGSALKLPDPTESGMVSTTGRRSPCILQKLERSVGVGRELRQDLESKGSYSSFLSKAEVKVEDANIVLEGTGDQVVRGKIYDYYVESSSHSITDINTVLSQYERDFESKKPPKPVLLRKESYLSAAQESELSIPFLTSRASTPVTHSRAIAGDESVSVHPIISPATDSKILNVKEGIDRETAEGAPFLDFQAEILDDTDLEVLKSKLDLGNCLETLCLAKKHGQTSLQKAALGVMSDNYLHVLRDPSLYGRLMAGEREQIQRQRMRGKRFVMVADMDPQDWVMYYYDDYKDTWHTLCLIPQEVISKACAMCTMDNYLFVAVGCQGTDREMTPSKRVFCYNPLTSIWKEISPMNEARPRCKLAALEGYIYAIGGECLSTVERYNPRLDRWTFVAPLPNDTFAVAHHVTVCDGELFVSGGTLKYMLLRYNPKTDTWRPSLIVGTKYKTVDIVAVGRFLYRFDVNPVLGVSVYRYHTVARLWYECSSNRILHCPAFQCVAMNDTIYCVSRHFTMKFEADEISPAFIDEDLSILSAAKGILFPFILSLPDKKPQQTSV